MTSKKVNVDALKDIWHGKTTVAAPVKPVDITQPTGQELTRKVGDNTAVLKAGISQKEVLAVKFKNRKTVIIESPYASEDPSKLAQHIMYAKLCLKDSLSRGEAPMVSHLLYNLVINDRQVSEHDAALLSHLSWLAHADLVAVYSDYGVSPGMQASINQANIKAKKVEYRLLGKVVG